MVILHYIASPFWGGGEQYIFDLCSTLRTTHDVHCVFVCQPGTSEEMQARYRQLGAVYTLAPRTKNSKFSYLEALRLASIMQREKVDIVHVHDRKEFFLCAYAKRLCLRKIRLVSTLHLVVPQAKSKRSWLWAYRQIDDFIFVSQLAADRFLSIPSVRKACRSVHIVHNSILLPTTNNSRQDSLREQYPIAADLPIVLYHGRVCPEKGIVQLLQAIAPAFHGQYAVVLAGNIADESREELERLLHHSPWTNYLYAIGFRTDCEALIRQCRVGVLPSIAPEAASLSVLEHMAIGSAVIASNNGSQPEFVHDKKEAILLPPGEWELWAEAIDKLTQDENAAKRMGEQAKKRFDSEFAYSEFAEKIYHIYAGQ